VHDSLTLQTLRKNLNIVEERLASACHRANRARAEVTLVAVTKKVSVEIAGMLAELGVHHFGENRPQELIRKARLLPNTIHWHLIGHLQRNKVDLILPIVSYIHSVDSVRLLQALELEAAKLGKTVPVMLEVNASGEKNKQGLKPNEVPTLVPMLSGLRNLHVKGLMTMAALQEPEACRPTFALLRTLRDRLRTDLKSPHTMEHLSMGMSNDFEVAVEEGATFVRLGSILFEGLPEKLP